MQRTAKIFIAAMVIAAIAALVWFYATVDPTTSPIKLLCPIKAVTGYDCPGCGFQRALHAALNGRWAAAWHYNAFIFFLIPVAAIYIGADALRHRHPHLHATLNHPLPLILLAISILLWWLLRNIL